MVLIDLICLGFLAVMTLLGFILGFSRSLRFFTSKIFGTIISIILCFVIGGTFYPLLSSQLKEIEATLVAKSDLLKMIPLAHIIYYIILFVVLEITRVIVVKIISGLTQSRNPLIRWINRLFGLVFNFAMATAMILLFLALVKAFSTFDFVQPVLEAIKGSKIEEFFNNNPIVIKEVAPLEVVP